MRARHIALFFIIIALAWGAPVRAAVLDSQVDDSAQAIRPATSNIFVAAGYVPTHNISVSGVRFRINKSSGADYLCPRQADIYAYYGTTTPPEQWGYTGGTLIGSILPLATTTPDTNGDCDYTTINQWGQSVPLSLTTSNYYVFFMAANGGTGNWFSMSGKSFASTTPESFFGYRSAFSNYYTWGTTGLDIPYFQFFDTAPPPHTPDVPPDPCVALGTCVSNVMFLPGIEGSRLYEGTGCGKTAEEKLWEPFESVWSAIRGAGDNKVGNLSLDSTGESVCNDIYTKENDIIDSVNGGGNIYKSFIDEMNGLKSAGTINDWKPISYDWRLSLDDLLNKGAEQDGKIYYEQATGTPYIEQTLRALAADSQTGKVTIVAHSNGGLLAKALLDKLEKQRGGSTATLVDKVIMVGAPQSGAPVDLGALLYGLDQGISSWGIPIVHSSVAQKLAENSPMAYHLLPSDNYLTSVAGDTNHPVARFAGDAYAKEISAYGSTINNIADLDSFILASTGLNALLVDYANKEHGVIDNWTPPSGIEVDQIAGWGVDTVAGIDFYTLPPMNADVIAAVEPRAYGPIFIEDGDGTVPTPSALMMASSTNVKRYWMNLDKYNREQSQSRRHKDLFEIQSLEDFIKNIIENNTDTLPAYISTNQPPSTSNKKLIFFLHSPLTLQLTDSSGNITGIATDDSITENIPGSTYGEFGDVKYVIVPEGVQYQLTLHGQDSGTFSLDMQESSGNVVTNTSTIASVPTTANTLATLNISNGIDTASALTVDENGDGGNIINLSPVVGATVSYQPPAPASTPVPVSTPAPQTSSAGGSISIPVVAPVLVATTSTIVPVIQPIATGTAAIAIHSKPPRTKKKASVAIIPPQKPTVAIPQTASMYDASQQSVLQKVGVAVYNGLYGFWAALKNLF